VAESIERFAADAKGQQFAGTFLHDINVDVLVEKLRHLKQSQRVQLYFAVTRLFWNESDESHATALCGAGLIHNSHTRLDRMMEKLDKRLIELEKNAGIKFPLGRIAAKH
jgi:hypothetical protein